MTTIFDLQPTLTGLKYATRPLTLADFEPLYAVSSEPHLWDAHPSSQSQTTHRGERDVFSRWFADALADKALIMLDQSELAQTAQSIIGTTRFYDADYKKREIAIGYTFLSTRYWGTGANKEIKLMLFDYVKSHFDVVWLHIAPNNARSRKAAEKVGAVFDHEGWHDMKGKQVFYAFYKKTLN